MLDSANSKLEKRVLQILFNKNDSFDSEIRKLQVINLFHSALKN